jgi:hypothetical protein
MIVELANFDRFSKLKYQMLDAPKNALSRARCEMKTIRIYKSAEAGL